MSIEINTSIWTITIDEECNTLRLVSTNGLAPHEIKAGLSENDTDQFILNSVSNYLRLFSDTLVEP